MVASNYPTDEAATGHRLLYLSQVNHPKPITPMSECLHYNGDLNGDQNNARIPGTIATSNTLCYDTSPALVCICMRPMLCLLDLLVLGLLVGQAFPHPLLSSNGRERYDDS